MNPPNLFSLAQTDEEDRISLTVATKQLISHDTYKFELKFPYEEWIAGLWPGGHCVFHAEIDGEEYSRKYTPISPVNMTAKLVFIIKIYRKNK